MAMVEIPRNGPEIAKSQFSENVSGETLVLSRRRLKVRMSRRNAHPGRQLDTLPYSAWHSCTPQRARGHVAVKSQAALYKARLKKLRTVPVSYTHLTLPTILLV
eukprot:8663089-Pyramimonas_sp.AAC.1